MNFSVPATSANLGPGFDCLGLSLSFRNHFSIHEAKNQSVTIYGEGEKNTKVVDDNMFIRIFNNIYTNLGGSEKFAFIFHNQIPISRGLGSSSAIIVGAIFSAFKMAGRIPNKQQILNIALHYEKHPDNITPAVMGGFTASLVKQHDKYDKPKPQNKDTDEALSHIPNRLKQSVLFARHRIPDSIKSVVVIPNHAMSTKRSRSALAKEYSIKDCVYNLSRSSVMSLAFSLQRWDLLKECSKDKIHEAQRMQTYPVLFAIQNHALDNGAIMSTLSGSGSSVFSLCYADDAERLQYKLSVRFPKFRVVCLDFDNDGVKLEKG